MKLVIAVRVSCVALTLPAAAQTLLRTVNGPAAGAKFGQACIEIADQNADGYKDLLVGAPAFNQERGAVYCVSGAHLATGIGSPILWSHAPAANPGDLFGTALLQVSDLTGDGVVDFLVGQPGHDQPGQNDTGAVRLLNGSSHVVTTLRYGSVIGEAFGTSLARVSPTSVAVGAPGPLSTVSHVYFHNTALFATTGSGATQLSFQGGANERLGASLASGFDLDGDGFNEIVAGSPGSSTAAGANAGKLRIFYVKTEGTALSWGGLGSYDSNFAGENLGESLDAAHDYDGDGVVDIVAGAPHHLDSSGHEVGRVLVLSGGALLAQTIYTFTSASVNFSEPHFGAAVKASRDLNGDGVGDIVVGEPDYPLLIPTSSIRGHVAVFSGATGKKLVGIIGGTHDQLGGAVTGAITDLDGDGFREIVATGPLSNANGTDSGVLRCYRLFPIAPATYCTGKLNSAGCTPGISFTGTASETSGAPFLVRASDFLNQKIGLLFYGHQPTSVAFQGGFKCVEAPTLRTLVQNSGGSASGADCTGTYSFDFNALAAGSTDPTLVAGAEVFAQYWARDPLSPSTTSLSNALSFVIHP